MKLALAFLLGAACAYAFLRKPVDEKRIRFEMWRDLERVDSV